MWIKTKNINCRKHTFYKWVPMNFRVLYRNFRVLYRKLRAQFKVNDGAKQSNY